MAEDLLAMIRQISKERGLDIHSFFSAIREALLIVARKYFDDGSDVHVELDEARGEIEVYVKKIVVKEVQDPLNEISWKDAVQINPTVGIGDEVKINLEKETLGRIAAQSARHIIMHRIMKAEQQKIFEHYFPLTGKLLTGQVRQIEKGNLILQLDFGEAFLPQKELSPRDNFKRGDLVKFLIKRVFPEGKGPLILGSRYMNNFVRELLFKEVPELQDGVVKIFSIVRHPGFKTKVAVYATDKSVDPVGAVLGMNGSRVLAVTKELNGERVDVVAWSNVAERFISSALTPGEIRKVRIVDPEKKIAEALVKDETLSATIGKNGLNVKLASRLTGWEIKIINQRNQPGNQKIRTQEE